MTANQIFNEAKNMSLGQAREYDLDESLTEGQVNDLVNDLKIQLNLIARKPLFFGVSAHGKKASIICIVHPI